MSEKFGLDWRDYDVRRMQAFLCIMEFEAEKANKDAKKADKSKQKNFRKRG